MSTSCSSGELRWSGPLLRSGVFLSAVAVWALNDHGLKARWPESVLTGKLSDFAAMAAGPVVVFGVLELLAPGLVARQPRRLLQVCAVLLGALMLGINSSATVERLYAYGFGAAHYPWLWLRSWWTAAPTPGWHPVHTVRDPSDIISLSALVVPLWLFRRFHG